MTRIDLHSEEVQALQTVLRSYLSDLHDEIAHTDSYDFREQLKRRQALLDNLLHRIGAIAGSGGA